MKVLITGGAGFIGSHLADALTKHKTCEVHILDSLLTGRRENIPEHSFRLGSVADYTRVAEAMEGAEVVVHCAASYNDRDNWARDVTTNTLGTVNVVKAAQREGVKRLIYFQTALCYGTHPDVDGQIPLDQPRAPDNSYAISKTAGEQYIEMSGLDYVIFRLANVYGPRNLSGPIPTFFKNITEGRKCRVVNTRRDFVYIDDVIRTVNAAVHGRGHGTYHLASGADYAIDEVYGAVCEAMDAWDSPEMVEPSPDDAPSILLNPWRAGVDFNWHTTVTLDEGIAEAVKWYREHGVAETHTHLKQHGPQPERDRETGVLLKDAG